MCVCVRVEALAACESVPDIYRNASKKTGQQLLISGSELQVNQTRISCNRHGNQSLVMLNPD